jgi:hypothetical protein
LLPLSPRLAAAGETHLAAFDAAAPNSARVFAAAYCLQRGAAFAAAGTVRGAMLPPGVAAADGAAALSTLDAATGAVCRGARCPFVAVVECVPAGAAACPQDEAGNIG